MFERLHKTFRENKRLWMVVAAASLTAILIIVVVFSGSSLEIGRFFASEGVCPLTPQGNTIVKPVLSVECGPSQNVLTWTNTEAIEAVVVELQRNAYIPAPILYDPDESTTLTTEYGCTSTLKINSYVDTTARPDLINNYIIQVGGRQGGWTNVVSCTPAPTPIATPASVVSAPGANAATLSVQCGTTQNVLTWTLAPGHDSNSILKSIDGADSIYACGGPDGIPPCNNLNVTTFTDTVQTGRSYTYTHKSCGPPSCRSNSVTCQAVTSTSTSTSTPTATTNPVLTSTPTATSCAALYPPVAKCYGVHACVGRSDAVCEPNDAGNEISYLVFYGFEDFYRAPNGIGYLFNWRSKNPPERDPTKWAWRVAPSSAQAWCGTDASGGGFVQAPTTDLHAIFDAQASAGRFGCAVGKVGAYNNTKNPDNIDCPAAEKAYYACRASLNDGVPAPTPVQTFEPTPPPPSPQAGTLRCVPATQTIQLGQFSDHAAEGGDGQSYRWSATPGAVQESGSTYFATYSWSNIGTKRVSVTSDGQTADCVVIVRGANAVLITKNVRNETARHVALRDAIEVREGNVIEFSISVGVGANAAGGPFRITDSFPVGLSYVAGSARTNGSPIADPVISDSSLTFPGSIAVPAGTAVVVEYAAFADRLGALPEGPQTATYNVAVTDTSSGTTDTSAAVTLTLFGTGTALQAPAGGPSQIPTGPGDAVTFALIAAAVSSLLYAAYTRSAAFRGREVRRIERDQGPMDFRS